MEDGKGGWQESTSSGAYALSMGRFYGFCSEMQGDLFVISMHFTHGEISSERLAQISGREDKGLTAAVALRLTRLNLQEGSPTPFPIAIEGRAGGVTPSQKPGSDCKLNLRCGLSANASASGSVKLGSPRIIPRGRAELDGIKGGRNWME